jgi:selenide,water dikinase
LCWADVPLIEGVADLVQQGFITGASARNWASYGHEVQLPNHLDTTAQALLTDPQTSGGLLVSCAPEAVNNVLQCFHQMGFEQAAVVGHISAGSGLQIQG